MLRIPIAEPWRSRLLYGAMSAFVTWHTMALIVGPAPRESDIAKALRPLTNPYLDLLYLNVGWGFFAPVGMTAEFRYTVVDAEGKSRVFSPTRGLHFAHPHTLWLKDRYRTVSQHVDAYGRAAAAEFCRKHAALKPVEIALYEIEQEKEFTPKDHLAGKTPLDAEFATKIKLADYKCTKS